MSHVQEKVVRRLLKHAQANGLRRLSAPIRQILGVQRHFSHGSTAMKEGFVSTMRLRLEASPVTPAQVSVGSGPNLGRNHEM